MLQTTLHFYIVTISIVSIWGEEGAVKYKIVSMRDHHFLKDPLNDDFFHAKMTP